MAAYDLEEQEQLDELKTWWKMYGNLVTGVVTAVALAMLAWQGWNWWQRNQSAQASALYAGLQQAATMKDAKRARELAGELIDKFSGTTYAGMAALVSAKAQAETGEAKTAKVQLTWAAEHAADDAVRDLARLRLAALLLDEQAYDEALKQLAADPQAPFLPRFQELKGDVLAAQGKTAEAQAAYRTALEKLEAALSANPDAKTGPYRDVLQVKLEALGAGK